MAEKETSFPPSVIAPTGLLMPLLPGTRTATTSPVRPLVALRRATEDMVRPVPVEGAPSARTAATPIPAARFPRDKVAPSSTGIVAWHTSATQKTAVPPPVEQTGRTDLARFPETQARAPATTPWPMGVGRLKRAVAASRDTALLTLPLEDGVVVMPAQVVLIVTPGDPRATLRQTPPIPVNGGHAVVGAQPGTVTDTPGGRHTAGPVRSRPVLRRLEPGIVVL